MKIVGQVFVPKNSTRYEAYYDEIENCNVTEFTDVEWRFLRFKGLFHEFDKTFHLFIDVCEEDRINPEDIQMAINITKKHLKKYKSGFEYDTISKVLKTLEDAKKVNNFWEVTAYFDRDDEK